MLKVHSVNTYDEGQRDEDTRHHRKHLHNLIEAIAHTGEVHIQGTGDDVSHRLYGVDHMDGVVVEIAEINLYILGDERRFVTNHGVDNLTHRPDGTSQRDKLAFNIMNSPQRIHRRINDDLIL